MRTRTAMREFGSKPPTRLGRGRLARAHACRRDLTSGCGADHSTVMRAKGGRREKRALRLCRQFDSGEFEIHRA